MIRTLLQYAKRNFALLLACAVVAMIQVFHPNSYAAGLGALPLAAGLLFPLEDQQSFWGVDKILYAYASPTTVNTPIWVAAFGALVPLGSYSANATGAYKRFGRWSGSITTGVTIGQGDAVYYITATGKVTNANPTSAGFLLGQAIEAGTASGTAGGTVNIELNFYYAAMSGAATCTTMAASGNATVGGTLTVTGASTLTGAVGVTGAVTGASTLTATKVTATAGRVVEKRAVSTLNSTGTISAANLLAGIITSTSAAAVAATLPAAADVLALIPGCAVGSSFRFTICNSAGANTVTVTASASITNALAQAGDMAVAAGSNVSYALVFTNVGSGTEAAVIYRLG